MPTHLEIAREHELLAELGLAPVQHWPLRCTWYGPDGSVMGTLPCDPYSRLRYMGRGLRPDVVSRLKLPRLQESSAARTVPAAASTLLDAVVELMQDRDTWEGTASELLTVLADSTDDVPASAARLSREINGIEQELSVRNIGIERTRDYRRRGVRLFKRQGL